MATRRAGTPPDPFAAIRDGTDAHRARHHCGTYPFSDGTALTAIAAATQARRILELGTALGYTALSLARGAHEARLDTIERDPDHVRLARETIAAAGYAGRITVHEGEFDTVLARLEAGYDLAFFDGFGPTPGYLVRMRALLRPRGVLISSNLDVGGESADYRAALLEPEAWLTSFALEAGRTAISVRL
jgi:predicted O-methyltransferase YrrM